MKLPFRESKGQKRLVVANQKGGVGKTLLTLQLGFYLAELDRRVLIVDMDGQQNITKALLDDDLDQIEGSLTSFQLFDTKESTESPLEVYEGLSLISSTEELHDVEAFELDCVANPASHLRRFTNDYDYILFDTPPSLGRRLMGACAAATHIVVPLQPAKPALDGLEALLKTVSTVQHHFNPELKYIGSVVNLLNTRSPRKKSEYKEMVKTLGKGIIDCPIPILQPIQDADDDGTPVWYQKSGNGRSAAKVVKEAITEILKRVQK